MKIRPANDAFSLVEIAIALAIIGLLAGGITVGSNLIQRSKVNQVMTGLTKYVSAFTQFKQQFQALPGDYVDATEQWGTDPDGCPTHTTRVPKKETCNGNGDGGIASPESYRLWQHLLNAGLINGAFTGVADSSGTSGFTPGENMPAGPLTNTGFFIDTSGPLTGLASHYDQGRFDEIVFGTRATNGWPSNPALTPSEQNGIDLKIDDGRPSTGWMRALKSANNPSCTTSDVDATAEYNLQSKTRACTIWHMIKPS